MQALLNKDDIIVSINYITEGIKLEKEGTLFQKFCMKNKGILNL